MRETDWTTAVPVSPLDVERWMAEVVSRDLKPGEYYHIMSGNRMVIRIQHEHGFEVWELSPQRVRHYP